MKRALGFVSLAGLAALGVAGFLLSRPISAPLGDEVMLEDMTWVEVRTALRAGRTTAIVPTGGTEQNGPHMILGKHNYIVRHTAERIARTLGNALVAPPLVYVPEGDTEPPQGHMRFAGTLSVPAPVFEQILEHAARSLKAHGFKVIAFVGDSGGNQQSQARVAERLDAAWQRAGVRVLHLGDYYAGAGQIEWLAAEGESAGAIGRHAGIRDTSELMAAHPDGIRSGMLADQGGLYLEATGVDGDPTRASAERGERLLSLKVGAAVAQIRALLAADPGR